MEVTIDVHSNPCGLPLDALFRMAARLNKKRSFLFVSRVLGKHIPVPPSLSLLAGAALACLYGQQHRQVEEIAAAFIDPHQAGAVYRRIRQHKLTVKEPLLFIGFAETATALGHSMYDMFDGPVRYLHTTREMLTSREPVISFEEEHSHATSHRCYPLDAQFLSGGETVVLVDDELTTGKTACNIISSLHQRCPRARYVVASLLDWRSEADKQRFRELERTLGITIECVALVQGELTISGALSEERLKALLPTTLNSLPDAPLAGQVKRHDIGRFFTHAEADSPRALAYSIGAALNHHEAGAAPVHSSLPPQSPAPYLQWTGRFGLDATGQQELDEQLEAAAAWLRGLRRGERLLCMGTGEFMYIPMRIAALLGQGTMYQSSTRSPVHPLAHKDYAIQNAYRYLSPDDPQTLNYMYNISPGQYDELFVFMERSIGEAQEAPFVEALRATRIPVIHIIYCSREPDAEVSA